MIGSGDFSIGSKVWPGTSKLLEEMGELQQVLGKLIAVAGSTQHWDGDLRPKLIEELGDVSGALAFFMEKNLIYEEEGAMLDRAREKLELFREWHEHVLPNGLVQGSPEDKSTWWTCASCDFTGPYVGETENGKRACLGSCGGVKRNPACTFDPPTSQMTEEEKRRL